jgi:predicted GIY-YIG superfamily endonuclease
MFYVYLLKNKETGSTYIGYTNDLRRRIVEHGNKNPEIIYYEAYRSEKDARKREKMLKQRGQAVRWLKERISDSIKI